MTSLQYVKAFSLAQPGEEQNREGYEAPEQTISTQLRRGRYRWYQSHALAGSVGLIREDVCARKGGGL